MDAPTPGFLRELRAIDPRYYVEQDGNIYNIRYFNEKQQEVRTVETFQRLNDSALSWLRFRKYLGIKFRYSEGPDRGLAKVRRQRLECKQKETDEAIDMITEAFMKAYKIETTSTNT